ncbi:Transcriptional regulator ATRX [Amphibalanus amphitrite]|uniref:Transcriptional regulator ATRX n=1 Tax=Amphibalanus amphitrite TaxID=1232801 RepID=A0A6A4WYA0_AMPAM|nr:Transcriptional regulator ATRX [Amphibalanus amphitrite]
MSATDSSEEDEKMKKKIMEKRSKELEKAAKKKADSDDPDADGDGSQSDGLPPVVDVPSSEEEVVEKKRSPRKKRLRIAEDSDSDFCILDSEGSAGSDAEEAGPSKKRGRSSSSSISSVSDSADDFQPPKKTRSRGRLKRIRRLSDDSQSSSGDDSVQEEKPESQGTPGKGGRKNIRHIREAEQSTKEASQAELERRKRIEDKQAMYNELFKKSAASEESTALDKLVLDFDPETKKPLVSVHKNFVKILKPHQVDGVKFMFDSTIESVARLEDETNQDNAGCIPGALHGDKVSCALVVCPKNTVQNWVRELKSWQKKCRVPEVDVVDITFRKDNYERSFELEQWRTEGGVCVLSYDMFKRFSGTGGKKGYVKKQKDRFQSALIDPGPDIVVCDEGHLLKNPAHGGNNLREYHTMVEFVKPRLLGSESEFSNRFIRPIENGSAVDALPRDVKLMKRRSHVLHKLLNSVVQRRDYNVLMPFLPPKLEFTLMVKLSDLQKKLYQNYLEKARSSSTRKVLSDFQALSRVWTHPRSIQMKDEQDDEKEEMRTEREAMERFVANDSSSEEENSKDGADKTEENGGGAAEQADDSEWWRSCIPDDLLFEDAGLSGKLTLLDQLLIKCENIGDKLLVFSQSLFTLNLIEEHLERLHKDMQSSRNSGKKHPSHVYFGTWKPDYDYFRLDGSTSEERRQLMCDRINKATNERSEHGPPPRQRE